ncbi:MAG: hypothetical protein L0Y39_01985 [Methylococcaceae bacterium]|nr:hypothetical protein [Methylococcaceae bacterium]
MAGFRAPLHPAGPYHARLVRALRGFSCYHAPAPEKNQPGPRLFQIIDLDLAKHDRIASRFVRELLERN